MAYYLARPMLSIQATIWSASLRRAVAAAAAVGSVGAAGCDSGLEPIPFEGISGVVALRSAVPDSTDWLRLVVLREMPQSAQDFLDLARLTANLAAFTEPLPLEAAEVPFYIQLAPGQYAWLLAVWKRLGPLDSTTLREAGTYYGEGGPSAGPASFDVVAGRETARLDLIVDFDEMRSIDELFPPDAGSP